ncbi:MAG: TfoX/Sxy family protein [Pseudomonadota bacterium]
MASGSDFLDHVLDLLGSWGGVAPRRMFGGTGLYRQGVMFALVYDDVLYFKVDEASRPAYAAAGMGPFTYEGKSRTVEMSYWEVPAGALEEPAELVGLAGQALAVALAAKRRGSLSSPPTRARRPRPTTATSGRRRPS